MSGFLNPEKIVEELSIDEEMNIVDFGCGSGGWVIPLAKKAKSGKIYAVDVLKEALSALKNKTELERIYNIHTVRCDIERGTDLPNDYFHLLIMSNLLFQVEDKDAVIKEGWRVLQKGGSLLVADWETKEDNAEKIIDEKIKNNEFKFVKNFNGGDYHFVTLYEKI